ncbi:MAG: 16S rRNA (guanine(966)-N(2))-methyltransferase RsmD [Alphaproteobacteria bacterium]|nr:16S rRNA (guanine(966)-N(2))-methyltransferase RsmD [Alphaproteobacteria bacterium]MBV8548820.1 16S rRNA (guanine(966)-N(2))-methyltransferase RsmD [Alphaproteobacteria bacterium]
MRIVGGQLRGRKFAPPLSLTTRPMMDRVRESLFNILEHHDWGRDVGDVFDGTRVLDAFCGTGALAFESLSRGAAHATLFDRDRQALQVATQNATDLKVLPQCAILSADTTQPPQAPMPCRLVFLAPPYRKGLIPPAMLALDAAGWMEKAPLIVAETARKEELTVPEGFAILLARFYGDTGLHFIKRAS